MNDLLTYAFPEDEASDSGCSASGRSRRSVPEHWITRSARSRAGVGAATAGIMGAGTMALQPPTGRAVLIVMSGAIRWTSRTIGVGT
jgi:hypothetical protein